MGRYTTVQAYADNNPQQRVVDYAQATGQAASSTTDGSTAAAAARGPLNTEKVDNPYGSTAGAGSGEFHVYRHARAREMARWKKINEDEAETKAEEEFQQNLEHDTKVEADKTDKRRRKRERAKEAKRRKKNMKLGGVGVDDNVANNNEEGEEFDYTPITASEIALKSNEDNDTKAPPEKGQVVDIDGSDDKKPSPEEDDDDKKLPFANDGSFLERMKKELANAE